MAVPLGVVPWGADNAGCCFRQVKRRVGAGVLDEQGVHDACGEANDDVVRQPQPWYARAAPTERAHGAGLNDAELCPLLFAELLSEYRLRACASRPYVSSRAHASAVPLCVCAADAAACASRSGEDAASRRVQSV